MAIGKAAGTKALAAMALVAAVAISMLAAPLPQVV